MNERAPTGTAGEPPAPAPGPACCSNCGAPFAPERRRFCPECGQETHLRPPTLGEFVQQFGGAYFSTEGALWRSLKLLLLKPGALTLEYLRGRRRHYVLPLRLYLTISLVALLALRIAASVGMQSEAVKMDLGQGEVNVIAFGNGAAAGMKDGVFFCNDLPDWLCKRIQRRIDTDEKGRAAMIADLPERFVANIGPVMFALLPLFALLLKIAWVDRRLRYTEHLVFALHLHAFWFLVLLLTLIEWGWAQAAVGLAIPGYALVALRRVYGGRWWSLLLRAGAVAFAYFVVAVLALALTAVWTLIF